MMMFEARKEKGNRQSASNNICSLWES